MSATNNTEFLAQAKLLTGTNAINNLVNEMSKEVDSPLLIITDKGIKDSGMLDKVLDVLSPLELEYHTFDDVKPNPTIENTQSIFENNKNNNIKSILALGGGSVIDTAKAVSILFTNTGPLDDYFGFDLYENTPMPLYAIPTTVGTGSEGGNATVLTVEDNDRRLKKLIFGADLFPKVAVLDGNLISGMPGHLVSSTGMDALTHAIEGYVSLNGSVITDALNLHAVKVIGENILKAYSNTNNVEAMNNMIQASCSTGIGMSNGGLGLVHGISHAVGATYDAPHGIVNAILLPYVLEYNWVSNPEKFSDIAKALRVDVVGLSVEEAAKAGVQRVFELTEEVGIPTQLSEIGVQEKDIDTLAEIAFNDDLYMQPNPRRASLKEIKQILHRAL
ncbi:MAG TPA: iron-containing alcohol dehydrogenase [Virgibacillus sp.]|nr:iron-containing alcohol dehydrogenase [Virgibacillus sp.]HLR68000.1 iron-containing alcohol dehydrogenase [Virgibacillus sp.]